MNRAASHPADDRSSEQLYCVRLTGRREQTRKSYWAKKSGFVVSGSLSFSGWQESVYGRSAP